MRKLRENLPNRVYHLISRVAHRSFFLNFGDRPRQIPENIGFRGVCPPISLTLGTQMKFLGMEQMKINLSRMIAAVVGVFSLFVMETFGESGIRKQSPSELFSLEMVSNEGRITGFISNKSTRAWGVYLPRNGIEGLVSVDISYTTNHVRCVLNESYVVWENIEHDGKWVCLNPDRIVKFVQKIPCDMVADLSREGGPTLAQCEIGGSLMATIRYVDVEAVKRGDEKVIDASRENRLFESCLMWNVNVVIRSQEGLTLGIP